MKVERKNKSHFSIKDKNNMMNSAKRLNSLKKQSIVLIKSLIYHNRLQVFWNVSQINWRLHTKKIYKNSQIKWTSSRKTININNGSTNKLIKE